MRKLTAWTLYWIGDKVWWLENNFFGHFLSIYRFYNWLMVSALRIQGDGEGPWEKV